MGKILFVGESLIDLLSEDYVDSIAKAKSFHPYLGGSPFNIATMLGDLGVEPIFLTRVGNDSFGYEIVKELKARNVDTTYVQIDPYTHTSMVLIAKSKEFHDFLPLRDADYKLTLPDEKTVNKLLYDVEMLHFSGWPISRMPSRTAIEQLIKEAIKRNIKICFDTNYRKKLSNDDFDVLSYIKKFLKNVYLVKPSIDDAYELFGEMKWEEYIEMFHRLGVKYVVLTLGKDGALISNGDKISRIFSLARHPVDSTGAGDGFWAGLYYGILLRYDIFESAEIGNIIAAFKTDSKNASDKIPSLQVLKKLYEYKEKI